MKPRLINNNTITEFETEAELLAAVALISPGDAATDARFSVMNKEQFICNNLLTDLRFEFKKQIEQGMTIAEAADVFNRTQTTFLALRLGWLREARVLANNTATGGSFTAGRKTFLLNSIDASIALL